MEGKRLLVSLPVQFSKRMCSGRKWVAPENSVPENIDCGDMVVPLVDSGSNDGRMEESIQ